MNANTYICSAGPCPSGTTTVDCNNPAEANKYDGHELTLASCPSAGSEEDTNTCLSFTHYHDEIWVNSIPGFGRNITLRISIGGKLIGTNSYQYKKPIVLAVAPYRAGGNNNNNDDDKNDAMHTKKQNELIQTKVSKLVTMLFSNSRMTEQM